MDTDTEIGPQSQAVVTELGTWPLDGVACMQMRLPAVEHPPGVPEVRS